MARVFNGSSDKVTIDGASAFLTTTGSVACSVAVWVKSTGSATGVAIYADGGSSAEIMGLFRGFTTATKCFTVITDNSNVNKVNVEGTITAFDGTWHHVALTQDASRNWAMYVDGVVDQSGTFATGGFQNPPPFTTIGSLTRGGGTGNRFAGSIAECANWTRQLSTAEVAMLAGGMKASPLAPDHYWPLLGVASPETDIGTASLVNGTLTGTTSVVGPNQVDYNTFFPSLASRRPVPMIKGPDKDKILSMRGNSF